MAQPIPVNRRFQTNAQRQRWARRAAALALLGIALSVGVLTFPRPAQPALSEPSAPSALLEDIQLRFFYGRLDGFGVMPLYADTDSSYRTALLYNGGERPYRVRVRFYFHAPEPDGRPMTRRDWQGVIEPGDDALVVFDPPVALQTRPRWVRVEVYSLNR